MKRLLVCLLPKGLHSPAPVWEEQAECLLALGKTEQAQLHFRSAWELLSKDAWLVANEPTRIERLKSQAD